MECHSEIPLTSDALEIPWSLQFPFYRTCRAVSLGCSAENLVQAAHANGLSAQLRFGEVAVGEIIVVFEAPQTFCLTLVSGHTGNRRPDLIDCFGSGRSWGALRHVCTS